MPKGDDADFLSGIRSAFERFETGPACALCVKVDLRPDELPTLDPRKFDPAATTRFTFCRYVGRNVRPEDGFECAGFERPPAAPLRQYLEYVRNTGRTPLPTAMFDEDWDPIGPKVRLALLKAGLTREVDGGIVVTGIVL